LPLGGALICDRADLVVLFLVVRGCGGGRPNSGRGGICSLQLRRQRLQLHRVGWERQDLAGAGGTDRHWDRRGDQDWDRGRFYRSSGADVRGSRYVVTLCIATVKQLQPVMHVRVLRQRLM